MYRLINSIIIGLYLMSGCNQTPALAKAINQDQAIRAILGEARGEGYTGMYAIACALRNRGHLRGVYGLYAKMPYINPKVSTLALKAWQNSLYGHDVTGGANHWENIKAFGLPRWAKGARITVTIGRHTFFRL